MRHFNNDNTPHSEPLRFFSVCSGIEAASVAWPDWEAVGFAEIDKAASALLAYRYPHVPNYGDFTTIDASQIGRVDILCGGTPCQAFSVAGQRRGLDDARGNLTLAFVDLAHELAANNGLRNAVWENVVGVLTMADNAFGCFLAGLVGADGPFIPVEPKPRVGKSTRWWRWAAKEKCHTVRWPRYGMVSGPKGRAAWAVKDAQFYGLAQRRERVLVVADFGAGADPAKVLLIEPGVSRHPPARGEAGQGVAAYSASSIGGYRDANVSGPDRAAGGDNGGGSENLAIAYAPETARCVATREGSSQDFESTTMVAQTFAIQERAVSENPVAGPQGKGWQEGIGYTLEARNKTQAVVYSLMPQNSGKDFKARPVDVARDKPHVLTSAVRRLTPKECERLQGFPDGYTRIPVRKFGKPKYTRLRPADMWEQIDGEWWLMTADGPRYRQLGNSWAVPKFRWLGERIQRFMPAREKLAEAA